MKTLMIDMDDVIVKDNFSIFVEEFLERKIDFKKENVKYRQELIGDREDEFRLKYGERNLYENCNLINNCYEVLKKLNDNYDIYIVTDYIWGNDVINPVENLKNKYEFLKEKLDFISPSKYIFTKNKKIMKFDVKIDDRLSGLENADKKLLFTSWSNEKYSNSELEQQGIIRVNNWNEVEKILINL